MLPAPAQHRGREEDRGEREASKFLGQERIEEEGQMGRKGEGNKMTRVEGKKHTRSEADKITSPIFEQ